MGHLLTLLQKKKAILQDSFNRADSVTTMGNANSGQSWVPLSGTWGISGNRAYNVSDVSGEIILIESGKSDYVLSIITNGQTVSASVQRLFNVVFRANDSLNFLMTRVTNGAVALFKNIAGTLTQIASNVFTDTDNVDINFRIQCVGNQVTIYVNGVQKISYTLTGGETVLAGYTKVGLRLTKTGAPTGAARADDLIVEAESL